MNKEIAKRWIKELRSGKYEQGKSRLRDENNLFCCLGVLCNIHAEDHPEIAESQVRSDAYLGSESLLPAEVKNWAGMKTSTGYVASTEKRLPFDLSELNDGGYSFKQIARKIEDNWKKL